MNIVHCDDNTCTYNRNGLKCSLMEIQLSVEQTNEFKDGNRICYCACQNYKEKNDAGTD